MGGSEGGEKKLKIKQKKEERPGVSYCALSKCTPRRAGNSSTVRALSKAFKVSFCAPTKEKRGDFFSPLLSFDHRMKDRQKRKSKEKRKTKESR